MGILHIPQEYYEEKLGYCKDSQSFLQGVKLGHVLLGTIEMSNTCAKPGRVG